jgi:glycosyltransferase involved in cell wall biosynthesis
LYSSPNSNILKQNIKGNCTSIDLVTVEEIKKYRIIFVYTHDLHLFFDKYYNSLNGVTLISHNSDHGVDEPFLPLLDGPNIRKWFCQNRLVSHPKLFSLPIGIGKKIEALCSDHIHIATEGPLGWSALRAALYLKLPLSTDYRTNFQSYSTHYGVGFLHKPIMGYLRKFHNRAHCTMVPTKALQTALAAAGFHKLKVVSRGVDTTAFDPAHRQLELRTQWGLGDDDLAVLCVGRLAPEKNLKLLVQAYQEIKQRIPRARLVLVGHGPMRQALQEQCPDAIFTGQLRGSVLAAHYASADLFLMPSMTETFGNVTTEAMASGLPVVAFNDAAAAEWLVDRVNGSVVALADSKGFVSAALALAEQPALRAQLGQAARQTALKLDWSRIVQQFEDVLQTVMHQANVSGTGAAGSD